jgi:hypothetical protein
MTPNWPTLTPPYRIVRRAVRTAYARNGNVGKGTVTYVYDVRDAAGTLILVGLPKLREAKAAVAELPRG